MNYGVYVIIMESPLQGGLSVPFHPCLPPAVELFSVLCGILAQIYIYFPLDVSVLFLIISVCACVFVFKCVLM